MSIILVFFIVHNSRNSGELSGIIGDVVSNLTFWLTTLMTCAICLVPFFIARRADYHFSENIINNLRHRKYEHDYAKKIYIKKLEQMTKATRTIMKFKRLYNQDYEDVDNYADKRMKVMVEVYKSSKLKKKNNANIDDGIIRSRSKSVNHLIKPISNCLDYRNLKNQEKKISTNKKFESMSNNENSEVSERINLNEIDKLTYNASKFYKNDE
jgi:hypothetical protein